MSMPRNVERILSRVLIVAMLGGVAASVGCQHFIGYRPQGNLASEDTFTYVSTPWEPLSVTLYDRRDDEAIWTVDVPIGSKVTVKFYADKKTSGTAYRPDIMKWEIYDQTQRSSRLRNTMAVPPANARMLRVTLREDTPEYPDEYLQDPEFGDPERDWLPVEPKRYRGVPVGGGSDEGGRGGSYYRAD